MKTHVTTSSFECAHTQPREPSARRLCVLNRVFCLAGVFTARAFGCRPRDAHQTDAPTHARRLAAVCVDVGIGVGGRTDIASGPSVGGCRLMFRRLEYGFIIIKYMYMILTE